MTPDNVKKNIAKLNIESLRYINEHIIDKYPIYEIKNEELFKNIDSKLVYTEIDLTPPIIHRLIKILEVKK